MRERDEFNDFLTGALRRLGLAHSGGRVVWRWRGMREELDSVLWPVVWSAAELLRSDEVSRLRTCAGADCGWMYVDRSRNGLRRWCEMETCGTREKSRRRSARRRPSPVTSRRPRGTGT